MSNIILTITGPSCSGKSTLTNMLVATGRYTEIVSTTTRQPRAGDVNGVNYHFVTREEFQQIEMLEKVEFNDNLYGGSVAEFQEKFASGLIPVIVVEPNGMQQINKNATSKGWKVINIFVDCPPRLQAERFLTRFADDYRQLFATADTADYLKFMNEYINRMASMQKVESKWADAFFEFQMKNDNFYVSEFGKENERQIVDDIEQMVYSRAAA